MEFKAKELSKEASLLRFATKHHSGSIIKHPHQCIPALLQTDTKQGVGYARDTFLFPFRGVPIHFISEREKSDDNLEFTKHVYWASAGPLLNAPQNQEATLERIQKRLEGTYTRHTSILPTPSIQGKQRINQGNTYLFFPQPETPLVHGLPTPLVTVVSTATELEVLVQIPSMQEQSFFQYQYDWRSHENGGEWVPRVPEEALVYRHKGAFTLTQEHLPWPIENVCNLISTEALPLYSMPPPKEYASPSRRPLSAATLL